MFQVFPDSLVSTVEEKLTTHFGKEIKIKGFQSVGGGCINHAGRLKTSEQDVFIKWNNAGDFPEMFETEAKGLDLLREPSAIRIPEVLGTGESGRLSFILLELIERNFQAPNYWELLGYQLADLHRIKNERFGLDYDNYIGSLNQVNKPTDNWVDFFRHHRLEYQAKLAMDSGKFGVNQIRWLNNLYPQLDSIFPASEFPSLIHGDLWSGNLITDDKGGPCLIDPAVYYGNREIEIAFTALFGGFSDVFYRAYQDAYPLEPGFWEREEIYNLYPLMVHVNLFGGHYVNQVSMILKKYS